jgi:hypothetical protein
MNARVCDLRKEWEGAKNEEESDRDAENQTGIEYAYRQKARVLRSLAASVHEASQRLQDRPSISASPKRTLFL